MIRQISRYDSPPLDEVASGVIFQPISGLRLPHFGLFWKDLFEEFPRCQHAAPIDFGSPAMGDADGFPVPWPRIWLVSERDDRLIQLQQDRFLLNWRSGKNRVQYESYGKLFGEFEALWGRFLSFLSQAHLPAPKLTHFELTYVNLIQSKTGTQSLADLSKVLRFGNWTGKEARYFDRPPSLVTWSLQFPLPKDRGTIAVKMNPAVSKSTGQELIRLELAARSNTPEPGMTMAEWFDVAHEAIVLGFEDLTETNAQFELWGKQGNG